MNSTDLQQALAAVPETAPAIETRPTDAATLQVRRTVVPHSRIVLLLNRWFRRADYIQVRLDAQGTFFWQQIDGQRSLEDIAGSLALHFSVAQSESREAVLAFTQMLMVRQLIRLRVAAQGELE